MGKLTLITGGVRSGKSRLAVEMARKDGGTVVFVATCVPGDQEMERRIADHKKERPGDWRTLEQPVGIGKILEDPGQECGTVIIDCLTLLVSNILLKGGSEKEIREEIDSIVQSSKKALFRTIIVTNEVGLGVVPASELGRRFRDAAGMANQHVARNADEVYLMTCGIPARIK